MPRYKKKRCTKKKKFARLFYREEKKMNILKDAGKKPKKKAITMMRGKSPQCEQNSHF